MNKLEACEPYWINPYLPQVGRIQHISVPFCESIKLDLNVSGQPVLNLATPGITLTAYMILSINPLLFHAHALNGINTMYFTLQHVLLAPHFGLLIGHVGQFPLILSSERRFPYVGCLPTALILCRGSTQITIAGRRPRLQVFQYTFYPLGIVGLKSARAFRLCRNS